MGLTYGFYDSLGGDRSYNSAQFGAIFNGLIIDGVFQNYLSSLAISAGPGMQVTVGSGKAWFNGTWTLNDADLLLTIAASHATLDRIDSVILEVDTSVGVRANSIKILQGTNSATPVHPDLTNTAYIHQYRMCDVSVAHTVASITSGMLTNKIGTVDCPYAISFLSNIPGKATAAELATGTDDTKFVTASAIKNSGMVPHALPGALGTILTSNGAGLWVAQAGLYRLFRVFSWASNNTFTPSANTKAILVECIGGGGGGGGAALSSSNLSLGSGGGAGSYAQKFITSILASYVVTIGLGGVGNSGAAGGVGGDTSFGAVCIAKGGGGGTTLAAGTAAAGCLGGAGGAGASGTGDLLLDGADGGFGVRFSGTAGVSGAGGGAPLGGGLTSGRVTVAAGVLGGRYGGGGSGGLTTGAANAGGAGFAGVCRIWEFW